DYGPHRLEGLRLLALIGPRALPALRDTLARRPSDLTADVACAPDEPPRPGDVIPCALLVRNASKHALAIAPPPDGPVVRLPPTAPHRSPRRSRRKRSCASSGDSDLESRREEGIPEGRAEKAAPALLESQSMPRRDRPPRLDMTLLGWAGRR